MRTETDMMGGRRMEDLLVVRNLRKYFPIRSGLLKRTTGQVHAVENVSFTLKKGEVLGIVGESGCGKSTMARTVLKLVEKTSGEVLFKGRDIYAMKGEELRRLRTKMQIVFQDPYSSLNPRKTVAEIVGEALVHHRLVDSQSEANARVGEIIQKCGLAPGHMRRYPHEFSGGQRQRIGIARALALNPDFVVCDEPVSALDVSIQAQVINLLMDLQQEMGLTYMFISHDLDVVRHISDRVGVMYLGSLVEISRKREIYDNPLHPYTQALLSAIPSPDPWARRSRIILKGDIPDPASPPEGCTFHTRCPYTMDRCRSEVPVLREAGSGHFVACHLMERSPLP